MGREGWRSTFQSEDQRGKSNGNEEVVSLICWKDIKKAKIARAKHFMSAS